MRAIRFAYVMKTVRENTMEFGDYYFRAPIQQELSIAECVIAYNAGDMEKGRSY